MTEEGERVEELADYICARTQDYRDWIAAGGGIRCGFFAVCPCCGYPYLYLDIEDGDPCPICLAPGKVLDACADTDEIARAERGHPAISLRQARRNVVLYEQVYSPGHPRYAPEGPPGLGYEMEFVCATAELSPDEWDLSSIAEDYFLTASAKRACSRDYFNRYVGDGRTRHLRPAGDVATGKS
jgi:hypothetical protein